MVRARPVVLIVEDEPFVLELAAAEFQDRGFAVVEAIDGQSATEMLASEERIDLLFTDIRLGSGMDGWSIAETARTLRPTIPVIYATGFSAERMRMVEGALFFKKPYRAAAIVAAAEALGLGGAASPG